MNKQTTRSMILIFILASASAQAGVLSGYAIGALQGGVQGLAGSGFTLPPIMGDTSVSLQCSPSQDSLDLPTLDVCRTLSVLNRIANAKIAFKIGPCDIAGQNPLSCNASALTKYCNDRVSKPIKTVVSEIRSGERSVIDAGRSKVVITGGDQYAKNVLCGSTADILNQFPERKKAEAAITQLSGTAAYGPITNTRMYSNSVQCYEAVLKAGKPEADAARYCSPQSIGSATGSGTASDVEIASFQAARESLKSPLNNAASSSFNDEADLKKKISAACGSLTNESAITACATGVINNTYNIGAKTQTTEAEIESKDAARVALFGEATEHRISVTHPTEAYKNSLPIQYRSAFAGIARKAMAQEALSYSFDKRISESKKELNRLMMQKTEMASKPFYGAAEAKKIQEVLSNAGAL
jgi:hypothetical protein